MCGRLSATAGSPRRGWQRPVWRRPCPGKS